MYHKVGIEKLSKNQVSKLLNGHRVRVKHGHGHTVHLSEEQHKKLHKAHQKGCGSTIQFDPYQIEHHGSGFFGDLFNTAKRVLSPVVRSIAPKVIDMGADFLKSKVGGALMPAGYGLHHKKKVVHKKKATTHRKGRGMFGNIMKAVGHEAVNAGANYLKSKIGSGRRKTTRRTKGRGLVEDLAELF